MGSNRFNRTQKAFKKKKTHHTLMINDKKTIWLRKKRSDPSKFIGTNSH